MNYFYYILITWAIMLLLFRVMAAEMEGRMARKTINIRWMLIFSNPYTYRRARNIIFMSILCYALSTVQVIFSLGWLFEMLAFIAVGVIADALGQILSYHYIRFRFAKLIKNAELVEVEIKSALEKEDTDLMFQNQPSFSVETIMKEYVNEDHHLAIVSMDGGAFVEGLHELPDITYIVEGVAEEAKVRLQDKGVKVTSYTPQNQMPFKDEKIDVIVNELTNYDKFEAYRVLKPGGYFIVDQMGSDNYREIANMFLPFRIKGRWDKQNCSKTLEDIGFQIVESFEDEGYIRFKSLSAVLTFMRKFSPERVHEYERFMNFYARILYEIEEKDFFDLSTHQFIVVAKKM